MKRLATALSLLWLTLFGSIAAAEQLEIRILHVNDFHGFAEPYRPFGAEERVGGIAYLASRANQLRKEKTSLLVSAGDMIQGDNWANLFQGQSVIQVMNRMRFDAAVLGNHEFDFGQDVLRRRISEAAFPVLGANVAGMEGVQPYIILEKNGVRIGIIGVVTDETPVSTHPGNVAGLRFISPVQALQKYLPELRKKSDLVLVLSHIGFPADRLLAEQVPGIDLIVGGHSHTRLTTPVKIGRTLIVQAWEHAKALGVVDLALQDGKVIRSGGYLEEIAPGRGVADEAVREIVTKYGKKQRTALNEKVAHAEVDLDGENVREKETNLGDLICDIMRSVSGAELCVINSGGIRTSIKAGEIRVKDVYAVLPFDTYVVSIKMKGREIREALEHGFSTVEAREGRFAQVSGLSVSYSLSKKKGRRVKEILIGGKAMDPDREYVVATNDFIASGGDGYKVFAEAATRPGNLVYRDAGRWLRDVVVEYLRARKNILPPRGGRILEIR